MPHLLHVLSQVPEQDPLLCETITLHTSETKDLVVPVVLETVETLRALGHDIGGCVERREVYMHARSVVL